MKKFLITICLFSAGTIFAQNPLIVKSVGTTVLEPSNTNDTENWKYNEWNGKRFYQGTGTPTKLCVTDGTTAGTLYIADIGSGDLVHTIPAQDFMYLIVKRFASTSPTFIIEDQIWKSDGTAAGTSLVITLPQAPLVNSGTYTSNATSKQNFSVIGNKMFFGAYDAVNGNELWSTEGTAATTLMVKDIKPGVNGSSPTAFCKLNNEIFFSAIETGSDRKLWKTDGTAAGTVQIAVPEPFLFVFPYIGIINNKMIFYGTNNTDGYEPYVSDGTAAGTFMLANINPTGNSHTGITENVQFKFNSRYCFFISTNGTNKSLWRTDGTSAGTIQLTANAENVASSVTTGGLSDIDEDGLWMLNYNTNKIYKSDGTVNGTYLAAGNLSYPGNLRIYKRALWFAARRTGGADDLEPWRSDGTAANTNRALDIGVGNYFSTLFSSSPFNYFVTNNKLYFFAKNENYFTGTPMALYQYNGDFTFNGSQAGGRWRDSTNWNSMMPPGITDTVNINTGTPNTLNITGQKAYAGVLNLGNNATINFAATTDSLQVNNRLIAGTNNNFTGNGVLVLKNNINDTVQLENSFAANNIAVQSNASLVSGNMTVNNLLNLNNGGRLNLNNNNVTLAGNSSTAAGNSASYIVTNGTGRMIVQNIGTGARTAAVNFPIGTVANYNPLQFTNTGVADNFNVRVQPTIGTNYTGETPAGGNYSTNVVNATWFITESVAGGSNATINLQWNTGQELAGFNRNISQFGHYDMGSWQLQTTTVASGANPYNLTGTGITSFSPFGVFNTGAVLPIRLTNFFAKEDNSSSNLIWATAFELNNKGFNIQHSTDAASFSKIGFVNSKGNSNTNTSYSFTHYKPGSGKNYYRLQAIDIDGKITYSNIEMVDIQKSKAFISIYPNPASELINIKSNEKVSLIELVDVGGRRLQTLSSLQTKIDVRMLTNGMYILKIWFASGEKIEEKIIIKN